MRIYVSDIEASYKNIIIGHMVKSDTAYLLLHIVQWCSACTVYGEKRALPMVL